MFNQLEPTVSPETNQSAMISRNEFLSDQEMDTSNSPSSDTSSGHKMNLLFVKPNFRSKPATLEESRSILSENNLMMLFMLIK